VIIVARVSGFLDIRRTPVPPGWTIGPECGIPSTERGYGQARNHLTGPDGRHHIVRWSGESSAPSLFDALNAVEAR